MHIIGNRKGLNPQKHNLLLATNMFKIKGVNVLNWGEFEKNISFLLWTISPFVNLKYK
jgi:hypothetical protein